MRIDLEAMRALEAERLINIQQHPDAPLLILNYTPACQYSQAWTADTLMCRGLIVDLSGEIVSRPFQKFFNLEEHVRLDSPLPVLNWNQAIEATKKLDGSLGILYPGPDGMAVATRGSFLSVQAKRATAMFYSSGYWRFQYDPERTYLFEILFPENRIVVDYGSREELVLLDVIDNETGRSVGELVETAEAIGCPHAEFVPVRTEADVIAYLERNAPNEEGAVIRFADGSRVKVKFAEHKRLHKLLTGVSARTIWESLMTGTPSLADIVSLVPDEFYRWVHETKDELESQYRETESAAASVIEGGDSLWSRKQWAQHILQPETKHLSAVCFQMLDRKQPRETIWKMLKPDSTRPYAFADEA